MRNIRQVWHYSRVVLLIQGLNVTKDTLLRVTHIIRNKVSLMLLHAQKGLKIIGCVGRKKGRGVEGGASKTAAGRPLKLEVLFCALQHFPEFLRPEPHDITYRLI